MSPSCRDSAPATSFNYLGFDSRVPIFGHPAWTHPVLACMANKTGASVVPTFALRERPSLHSLRYDEAVVVDQFSETEREDVLLTTRHVKILEVAIRERPEQWLWYHDCCRQIRLAR